MLDDFQKESEKNEIVKEELPRSVLEKSIRVLDSKNQKEKISES
jgi:uncharacterized protein YaaW (UPF0174 family)